MMEKIRQWFGQLFGFDAKAEALLWSAHWSRILQDKVTFYRALDKADKELFEQRVLLFLQSTRIEAGQFEITDQDRLLVAASAIIPVWGFPKWHYFNLAAVYLLPAAFNDRFECGQPDSVITGMVGTGPMAGKMALCRSALHQGFDNSKDKQNVGIHEFVHLLDMADGECDGYPERLKEHAFSIPWFELVGKKIKAIESNNSNIREYGATNRAEFFSVASEYFFERPGMMQKKHPELFDQLSKIYQQDVVHIANDIRPRKKSPCPCGSKKRYKHCCMPAD
ncbi:zinc-dependent peptidase [Aestuariirhabdus sp. Z084]|uniref:M90 family metallopeptidase n=1 Tax=Aestuariirhabdus haliotis TaxID=2918751 RepID=UPI00201B376C|nr:zinc-dependent peptidase [Aestuariirhabdus haliotis]MCL6417211.1 zinc-dependent peptidase [Aestuariirhabdus haliotis]MCL6421183.1 zinc-dependent peptidase [Aestuariirhabdus haliotis]